MDRDKKDKEMKKECREIICQVEGVEDKFEETNKTETISTTIDKELPELTDIIQNSIETTPLEAFIMNSSIKIKPDIQELKDNEDEGLDEKDYDNIFELYKELNSISLSLQTRG